MNYEVLVVGGGIGGLTVAALLAARGVSVCLFERENTTGGCLANVSTGGYEFEGGAGLYSSWGAGELHEQVLAELKTTPPEVRLSTPAYVVRMPDATDVALSTDNEEFEANIARAFPECAREALAFYGRLAAADVAIRDAVERWPDLRDLSGISRLRSLADARARNVLQFKNDVLSEHLSNTSPRFRQFIDAQLYMLAQCSSSECSFLYAAVALMLPRRGLYAIKGGGGALAEHLTNCIRQSGGTVRVNAPVLRLAYGADGTPAGIDLLSGETVYAGRAIISNLTVWDTYGKLVGRARMPPEVREPLKTLQSGGAYMLYLAMDEAAAQRLPADHLLVFPDQMSDYTAPSPLLFAATPAWDIRGPAGKRAVTVWTPTDTESWFTFHSDQQEIEDHDQQALETYWAKIHSSIPELGDGIEVIETENPQSHYQRTRRSLGMVAGVSQSFRNPAVNPFGHKTSIPKLFMVGDTLFPGQGVAAVTYSAMLLANELAPPG
jgi:prolycopene isomerase